MASRKPGWLVHTGESCCTLWAEVSSPYDGNFKIAKTRKKELTIESTRLRIEVLNHPLIDEDPLGPRPGINLDGIVRRIDFIDDEPIWEIRTFEEKIALHSPKSQLSVPLFLMLSFSLPSSPPNQIYNRKSPGKSKQSTNNTLLQLLPRPIQVAHYPLILLRLRHQSGVVECRVDVIWFQHQSIESGAVVVGGKDARLEREGARVVYLGVGGGCGGEGGCEGREEGEERGEE